MWLLQIIDLLDIWIQKMGKKMGENSKAVAARDRKNEKEQQQKAIKEKAAEDAKWADDDKALAKKQVG